MAILNKDFRLKNGLIVEGTTGTINGYDILTKNSDSDQYIINLIGGETLVTSVNSSQLEVVNGELSVKTGVFDAYGDASAVGQDLSDHISDTSTHGVTGDIVGTSDSQSLSNKKFLGATYFQSGGGAGGTNNYLDVDNSTGKLTVRSGYALDLTSQGLVNIVSNGNNIVLDADGDVYLSSVSAGNQVATQSDLDALGTRDNTYNTLVLRDGFGNFAASQIDLDSKLTAPDIRFGNAGQIHDNDGDLQVRAWDNNTLQLTADINVVVNANGGNIDLNTTGSAYVNEDEIVTVSANQTLSNKTISGGLSFNSVGTITDGVAGIEINASNGYDATIFANNITLNPMANAYIGSASAGNEIATMNDLDTLSAGLTWKEAVNLLWDDTQITMSGSTGTLALDGHAALTSANDGYRILTINMGTDNGIWVYSDNGTNWSISRAADADTNDELKGAAVFVMEGTTYGASSWVQSNHYVGGTGNFEGQDWHQFSGNGSVTAGTGIIVNGLEVSVDTDVIATQTDLSTGLGTKQDTLSAGDGIYIDGSNQITSRHYGGGGLKFIFSEAAIDRNTVDGWYDASGAASTAEQNANYYTDGQLENYTPTSSLESTIDGYGFAYTSEIPTSTDGLSEGTSNLYFTDERAKASAKDLLTNAQLTNIVITENISGFHIAAENGVADSTTDDLTEGENNLYFTSQRVYDAIDNSDITPASVSVNYYRKEEATQQYVNTPSTVNVHSFSYPYESAKYLVRVVGTVDGVKHSQLTEILLTTDGNNNIAITEYGTICTATGNLASFSASYSGGAFNLTGTTVVNGCEIIAAATMLSWAD